MVDSIAKLQNSLAYTNTLVLRELFLTYQKVRLQHKRCKYFIYGLLTAYNKNV